MSNMISSYGIPNGAPQQGFGGSIAAARSLPVSRQYDSYSVTGSGSISRLTALPRGASFELSIEGTPIFVNSAWLKCPANSDHQAVAGEMIVARFEGNGVWRIYPIGDMLSSTFNDNSFVPVASGVRATEVADFANGKYWLNGRSYPSLMSWLQASNSSFTRNSPALKIDKTGRLSPVTVNVPRLAYDSGLSSKGILIEGAITNRLLFSQDFTNAAWLKGDTTLAVSNVALPDGAVFQANGANMMAKLVEGSATGAHYVQQQVTVPADTPATFSIFVKAGTRSKGRLWWFASGNGCYVDFDLATGTIGAATNFGTGTGLSASIVPYKYGWYRIALSGLLATGITSGRAELDIRDASGNTSYAGDGASYLYVWGAQLEASVPASSYIQTPTPGTRQSELLYRYLDAQPPVITKVLKARTAAMLPPASDFQLLIHMDDGSESNDFEVWRDSTGKVALQLRVDWVEQGVVDLGTIANNTDFTIAYRSTGTEIAASLNGGAVVKLAVASWPSTMTTERYGVNATEGRFWFSTIAYEATIPVAATDAELQALST